MQEVRGLIFYSNGHNGDIHYSRNFVKDIMSQMPIQAEYKFNCSAKLLKDILNLSFNNFNIFQFNDMEILYDESTKCLFVNTWVGSSRAKFIQNEVGCSLTANYNKFKEIYSNLNLELKSPDFYVPDVNWSKYDTSFVDEFISKNVFKKYILIANGEVLSGQSSFIDFNLIVKNLSIKYTDVCFIMTDITNKIYQPNVFYTSDFIKTDGGDLNEIGYLSTKVNFIIGRGSGPFCFAHNKDNLFDKNKKFLAITKYRTDGLWALPEQLPTEQAKQLWTNMFDNNTIYSIISKEIESD
jgi:hypothetical protein